MLSISQFFISATVLGTALAQGCAPLELIYARATTEAKGLGAAGGRLAKQLKAIMPAASVYAVDYPASMNLNGGGCQGAKDLVKRLETRSKECPAMLFALGGHSQGGAVVTVAGPLASSALLSKVVAVTMFGSPPCADIPQLQGRCKSFCNKGDNICDPSAGGNGGPRIKCGSAGGAGAKGKSGKGKSMWVDDSPSLDTTPNSSWYLHAMPPGGVNGCGDDERGHKATGGQAHMAYNKDGFYVDAAACYINKMFLAAGGKGGAAA